MGSDNLGGTNEQFWELMNSPRQHGQITEIRCQMDGGPTGPEDEEHPPDDGGGTHVGRHPRPRPFAPMSEAVEIEEVEEHTLVDTHH